jgi:hypothetical protein
VRRKGILRALNAETVSIKAVLTVGVNVLLIFGRDRVIGNENK